MRDLLVTANVGLFNITDVLDVVNWSIAVGKMPEKPDRAITAYDSGGQEPNPQWLVDYPTVQIKIRGGENDYIAAFDKAEEVKDALLGLPSQEINGEIWTSVSLLSDRTFLGYDQNGRPEFSINFRLIVHPPSGTYRKSL